MLEYFTYKKIKKQKTQKEAKEEAKRLANANADSDDALDERAHGRLDDRHDKRRDDDDGTPQTAPVLRPEDEKFLAQLLEGKDGPAPPLPPRNYLNEFGLPSDNEEPASASESRKSEEMAEDTDAKKGGALKTAEKKPARFAFFFSKSKKSSEEGLEPHGVPPVEGERETRDLGRVLDRLNLSAKNNKVVSTDSSELLQKFTQVFKDLVNGVPTAYDDLAKLVEDRDGTLSKGFDKLPSSLQKLVTQLPDKITGSLGPEILAAAASKQGIKSNAQDGVKGVAKSILMPHNLAELVTKPGAIVGMLRAIVEVLKTRWPAFIGMNVIWSVALTRELSPKSYFCVETDHVPSSAPLHALVLPQARPRSAPGARAVRGGHRRQ